MCYADMILDIVPLESHTVIELDSKFSQICNNPSSTGNELREAAVIASKLSAHYSASAVGLIENGAEADMNKRMGDERRAENALPTVEKTVTDKS